MTRRATSRTSRGRARAQQLREREILIAAHRLLREEGYPRFSMGRLAEASGYSRAALYNYFPSKEDVMVDVAIQAASIRYLLHRRVEAFDGRPRERMVALGEVGSLLYPDLFFDELAVYTEAVRRAATPDRQDKLHRLDLDGYELGRRIVDEAVQAGDLVLDRGMTDGQTIFALASLVNGVMFLMSSQGPRREIELLEPETAIRRAGAAMLDGLGWRPLSDEWDYRETVHRIYREVFPTDLRAQLLGTFGEGWEELRLPTIDR